MTVLQAIDSVITDNAAIRGLFGNPGNGGFYGDYGLGIGGGGFFTVEGSCLDAETEIARNVASNRDPDISGPYDVCAEIEPGPAWEQPGRSCAARL